MQSNPQKTTKILLMRHAESFYNQYVSDAIFHHTKTRTHAIDYTNKILMQSLALIDSSTNPDILNTKLTPKGISECQALSQSIHSKYPKIKKILLSPMRRAIQTFEHTFFSPESLQNQSIESVAKNISIEFLPEIRESVGSSCDLACWPEDELSTLHLTYNWDFMKAQKDPYLWFLAQCDQDIQDRAYKLLEGCQTLEEKRQKLLADFVDPEHFYLKWEGPKSNYNRIQKAKQLINNIIKNEN